jgi:hypothetical protein
MGKKHRHVALEFRILAALLLPANPGHGSLTIPRAIFLNL